MFLPEQNATTGFPRIKIIGIGGAGIHIISAIANRELPIDLIAMDSSSATLEEVAPMRAVRLGPNTTKGLGFGASVEAGAQAAHASRAEIADVIDGTELLLLVAGLGGGVGSGAIRVIADMAVQMNNRYLVSVIVDDTNQLRSTLRSFGQGVSIISPEKMKFQIHQ